MELFTRQHLHNRGPDTTSLIVCLFVVVLSSVLQSIIYVMIFKKGCSRHAVERFLLAAKRTTQGLAVNGYVLVRVH